MIKYVKRSVSVMLTILMVVGVFTALPITASAATGVTYLDADGATQTCSSYETFTGQRTWGAEGETKWYVAESDFTYPTPSKWGSDGYYINVYGDVHLIIKDGVKISFGAFGVKVREGGSLTIYAQSTGSNMGELYSNGTTGEGEYFGRRQGNPGIDGTNATVTINGGKVTGQAGRNRIGIDCTGGTLTVNGGDVYAYSRFGNMYAGVGNPEAIGGINSTIVINGGHVSAQNNDNDNEGYAVGCAPRWGWSSITINGGYVEAYARSDKGAAFGGTLKIADDLYVKAGNVISDIVYVKSYGGQAKAQVRSLIPVTNMTINKTSTNLVVGKDTEQLSITSFTPSDATFNEGRFVVWSSSDESVATVDKNGLVTPHWDGTAIISARITNDTEDESDDAIVTCTVNVTVIHVSAIPLDKTNLDLFTYSRPVQLTPTINPEDTSYQEIKWSTSDENVVTVDQNGLVTVQSSGNATITARATNGTPDDQSDDKISTCTVTVRVPDPISYLDYENGEFVKKTITDYVHFDDTSVASLVDSDWGASGKETFVYVDTVETVNHRINALGDVHLIIADGASMTINGGLHVSRVNALTLHVQSLEKETTGQLTVSGGEYQAGIGGNLVPDSFYDENANASDEKAGSITINGGIVTARGGSCGAGIGSGGGLYTFAQDATSIVINAGYIKAYGGSCAAGIGGGGSVYKVGGDGGNIIIRGGIVEASGTGAISGGTAYVGDNAGDIRGATVSVAPGLVIKAGTNIEDAEYFTMLSYRRYITSRYAYISLPVAAESISLPETSVTLTGDETISLRPVTFVPVESSYNTMSFMKWTTSDDTIATVDANGLVTPLRDGTVTITATANNGTPNDPSDDKIATCTVTVVFVEEEVSLEKSTIDLTLNGPSEKLVSTVSPANATIKTLVWSSSDPTVATVDQNGVVTPKGLGTATVSVTATNRTETTEDDKTATCEVSVTVLDVEEITLDKTSVEMEANRATVKLNPTIAPQYTSYRSADMITWESDNPAVATVDKNGVVSAHWEGTATITATATNGTPDDPSDDKTATCSVTVSMVNVTEPTLSESEVDINLYRKPYKLTGTIHPDDASYKTYKWESDDPTIATVDQSGYVTPVSVGTTTIRFIADNGSPEDTSDDKIATCTVNIVIPDEISYLDYDTESGALSEAKTTAYSLVYDDDTQWGKAGEEKCYYVDKDITINNSVYVISDVHLILADNATLTVKGGISLSDFGSLTIYSQSQDEDTMGKLKATGGDSRSGIGSSYNLTGGAVTINGGVITAKGANSKPGIGGINVTINSGIITANGGTNSDGIHAGLAVTINGGTVKANGVDTGSGITGKTVTVNGGSVTANGGGLGGSPYFTSGRGTVAETITVNGGKVWTHGFYSGVSGKLVIKDGLLLMVGDRHIDIHNYELDFRVLRTSHIYIGSYADVTGITLNRETLELMPNTGTANIGATVTPTDSHRNIVWSSDNPDVATVDQGGNVTARWEGTATITATATNGTEDTSDDFSATCTVTVTMVNITGVTLETTELDISLYRKPLKLTATVEPSDASYKTISYASDDPTIAEVDQDGNVIPVSPGTTTIRYIADNGSPDDPSDDKTAVCTVNVFVPDEISYLDYDAESGAFNEEKTTTYSLVYSDDTSWGAADETKWYYVDKDITLDNTVYLNGDVRLILADNATLDAQGGIRSTNGSSLTIYSQSQDKNTMGKLIAKDNIDNVTGIDIVNATLTVNGGVITANGSEGYSGIGAFLHVGRGTIIVNGGVVTSTGVLIAGIYGCDITVNNGELTSFSRDEYGLDACTVTINSGEVASTGENTVGINDCTVTLNGGKLTSTGKNGAGIQYSNVVINRGVVTATSEEAEGISNCEVTIDKLGKLTASGKEMAIDGTVVFEGMIVIAGDNADNAERVFDYPENLNYAYVSIYFDDALADYAIQNQSVNCNVTITRDGEQILTANVGDTVTVSVDTGNTRFREIKVNKAASGKIQTLKDLTYLMGNADFIGMKGTMPNGESYDYSTLHCKLNEKGNFVLLNGDTVVTELTGADDFNVEDYSNDDYIFMIINVTCSGYSWQYIIDNGDLVQIVVAEGQSYIFASSGVGAHNASIGEEIPVTTVTEGSEYTFTMPSSDVIVKAISDILYNISDESENGNVTAAKNGETISKAIAGETVTLNVNPDEGYALKDIAVYAPGNSVKNVEQLANMMGNAVFQGATGEFPWGESFDYSDMLCKVNDEGNIVVMKGEEVIADLSEIVHFGCDNSNPMSIACVIDTPYNTWNFFIENGVLNRIAIPNNDSYMPIFESYGTGDGKLPDRELELTTVEKGKTYTFTMPNADVRVAATFEESAEAPKIKNINYKYNLYDENTAQKVEKTVSKTVVPSDYTIEQLIEINIPYIKSAYYDYSAYTYERSGDTLNVTINDSDKKYTVTVDGKEIGEYDYLQTATINLDEEKSFIVDGKVVYVGKSYSFYVGSDIDIITDEPTEKTEYAYINLNNVSVTDEKVELDMLATANVNGKYQRMGVAFALSEKTEDEIAAAVQNVTTGTGTSNKIAVHNSTVDWYNQSGQYQFRYAPYFARDKAKDATIYFYTYVVTDDGIKVSNAAQYDMHNLLA